MKVKFDGKLHLTDIDVNEKGKVSSTGKTKQFVYETFKAMKSGEVTKIKVTWYTALAEEEIPEL